MDPLADKYPGWSPYNYCINNPMGVVDSDGMEFYVKGDYEKDLRELLGNTVYALLWFFNQGTIN